MKSSWRIEKFHVSFDANYQKLNLPHSLYTHMPSPIVFFFFCFISFYFILHHRNGLETKSHLFEHDINLCFSLLWPFLQSSSSAIKWIKLTAKNTVCTQFVTIISTVVHWIAYIISIDTSSIFTSKFPKSFTYIGI